MKFLMNGLSGREPMAIDLARAVACVKAAEKFGMLDALSTFFNQSAKPYVTPAGTAVISFNGPMGLGLTQWDRMTGGVDMADLRSQIKDALANPGVKRLAIHGVTPGGTVMGLKELASIVASAPIPTMFYTDQYSLSAGTYLGAQADHFVAAPSAYVGSVGTILVDESYQGYYDQMGIKVHVFRSGEFKAANVAGTGYTEKQAALEQSQVDAMGKEFQQAVLAKRTMASVEDMQGQVFTGEEAAQKNLITGLADTLEEALAQFESPI